MYASMERITAKRRQQPEYDASRSERKCFYYKITCYAKLFLAPASRVPANNVFLVLLKSLIFERPIQIRFRINLVSAVIKCYQARPTE